MCRWNWQLQYHHPAKAVGILTASEITLKFFKGKNSLKFATITVKVNFDESLCRFNQCPRTRPKFKWEFSMNNYRLFHCHPGEMQAEPRFNWQSHNVAWVYAWNNIHLIEHSFVLLFTLSSVIISARVAKLYY